MGFNTFPPNPYPVNSELLKKLDDIAKSIDDMPTFTSNDKSFLEELPAFPSSDGVKVLTATTESGETSLSYEELESELPVNPTEDGTKVLTATTESGETVLSWEESASAVFDFTGEVATGWILETGKELFIRKITNINAGTNSQERIQIGTDTFYDKAFLIFGWVERNVDGTHTKIPLPVSWPEQTNSLWQITVDDTTHKAYVDRRMPTAVLQGASVTFFMGYTKITT